MSRTRTVLSLVPACLALLSCGGVGPSSPDRAPATPGELVPPKAGDWVDVSPPVDYKYVPLYNYGVQALGGAVADAPRTLYLGTCLHGVWKTTDGGQTWARTNDHFSGRNWSLVVDPTDSRTVYTTDGYGINGLWKTTDGGATWVDFTHNMGDSDVSHIEIDPHNHLHLLVSLHGGNYDLFETLDGGTTWTNKGHPWGANNTFVYFLGQDNAGHPSSSFWLGFAENAGLWRTENSGTTWTRVSSTLNRSHAGAGYYRAANGAVYAAVDNTIARSTDNGRTWTDLATAGNLPTPGDAYAGIAGDGTTIFTMPSNTGSTSHGPYHWLTTPESGDGLTWTQYNEQVFDDGPENMVFDPVNRVFYASQWSTGMWRLQR